MPGPQLASPRLHDSGPDLWVPTPNAAEMPVYGSQADSQLGRHFRIGPAAVISDEGHSHAAPARWQCGQEAGQLLRNPSFRRQRAIVGCLDRRDPVCPR
jgi:hypothetical protein